MPFNGSGFYSRVYDWTDDRDNGIKIRADRMDGEFDDIAASLNVVFFRNGLVPMSGDLDLGSNDILGIANGTAAAPSVQFATDPNTGMFLVGAGVLGFAANGVERLEVNTTGAAVTGALAVSGNATVGGTFAVTGASTLTGAVSLGSSLFVTGTADIVGLLTTGSHIVVNGNATVTGTISATGFVLSGGTVWTSVNDGPASGLNADLLDGLEAVEFLRLATGGTVAGNVSVPRLVTTSSDALRMADAAPFMSFYNALQTVRFGAIAHDGVTMTVLNEGANGNINIVTTGSGVVSVNGGTVWHSANDGAGSGLDADLLDGVQAASFAQLVGAAFTGNVYVTDSLYLRSAAAPFFFLQNSNGTVNYGQLYHDTGSLALTNSVSGGALYLGTTGGGQLLFNGVSVWHASNDGAGSGLDADLLDGAQGALYLKGARTSQLVTDGTAAPSGGTDGDIYFQYV